MNSAVAKLGGVALAAVGSACAALAFFGGGLPPLLGAFGALFLGVALALPLREWLVQKTVTRRFRERLEAGSHATDLSLPEPAETFARVALELVSASQKEVESKTLELRRSRLAARGLQTEHAAFRALLDNLGDGVVLFDATRAPTIANRSARRFLGLAGLPHDAPLPRDLALAIPRATLRAPLERALVAGDADSRKARNVDVSDSSERLVVYMQFQEIVDPGASRTQNEPTPLAVLLRDVTREVELDRMKSDFASSVSHELKTPLCSMRAFLEMLIDGDIEGEEAQREHLRLVLDQTDRLTRLIQNLLNLSRLEAGITKMNRDAVALPDLLARIEDVGAPLARARQQMLKFEVSGFLPTVTGDASLLEQAILNLVSNAIKYTPEGGSVRVTAGIHGREVEIRVIDTGVGIPPSALDLIFEKFTRIENSAGLKATGTGLGLPLAKFVAEAHGGRITVRSEVGKGSEFKMLLPLRRSTDDAEAVLVGLEGISK